MNYFDHAASSDLYPEVLDILMKAQREDFFNPSSQHILGHALHEKIEEVRLSFLKIVNASKNDQFIFTSSATESNNTVIKGLNLNKGDVILYCKADHPSVVKPVESLGLETREILLTSEGSVDVEAFKSLVDKNVKLVVLSTVNNQSGVISDIELLSKIVKDQSSAHVHVDAVQSFGKMTLKFLKTIDSISVTSHKMGGPKGVAGLYLKEGHKIKPLLLGGGQENQMRSSTEAYPLILGFHGAMKISLERQAVHFSNVQNFSEVIKENLSKNIPEIQWCFKNTSPYVISFILPGISSDIILRHLEMRDVFISSTAACSSKIAGFNSSLQAMNIPERYHKNFLRISLGSTTTEKEVKTLVSELSQVWESLKGMQKR